MSHIERRKELKDLIRKTKQDILSLNRLRDTKEREIYQRLDFKSKASDTKGRTFEYEAALDSNFEYNLVIEELSTKKLYLEELEDLISGMNFAQRERLITALRKDIGKSTTDAEENWFWE